VPKSKLEAEKEMRKQLENYKGADPLDGVADELNDLTQIRNGLQATKRALETKPRKNNEDRFKVFDEQRAANLRQGHLERVKKQEELQKIQTTIAEQTVANNAAALRLAAMPDVMGSTELKVLSNIQALEDQLSNARQF
jgi:hypothetical protein